MTNEEKERKERMKEYRRRYREKHGIHHRSYPWSHFSWNGLHWHEFHWNGFHWQGVRRHSFHWKKWAAVCIGSCIVGVGGFFFAQSKTIDSVTLDGQPVSHMTEGDVRKYLDSREADLNTKSIVLQTEGMEEELPLEKLNVHFDRKRINSAIYLVGRTGTPLQRINDIYTVLRYGKDVPLSIAVNHDKLTDYTQSIHDKYNVEAKNAYAVPDGNSVVIHKEMDCIVIDPDQLKDQILGELQEGKTDAIEVAVQDRTEPEIKTKDLAGINCVLSSYTTHFAADDSDRDANINLGRKLLNYTLVPAEKAFSFNSTVGTRTKEKGYKNAPVYFDNKVVMDAGGGVCQVSTTLFNAVLRAGLIIDQRSPHFAPAGYVPVGMDATVADNSLDFGFTNPFKHPVYIYAAIDSDSLTVYILGNKADTCTVNFTTVSQQTLPHEVIYKHDDTVQDDVRDQEGYDGHDITIRRDVAYKDGDTYTDNIVSHYDPNSTIIRTSGPSSDEKIQTTNLDGEQPQDVIINKPHDMTE